MVIRFLFLLLWIFCVIQAEEVRVETVLDHSSYSDNEPINGSIFITRNKSSKVEGRSFSYQKKNLPVEFLRQVEFPDKTQPLVIDTYRFKLDPFPVGLQILPSISVLVGGTSYSSTPLSFEVKGLSKAPKESQKDVVGNGSPKAFLKLETIFLPDGPLFPGQKATIGYRYTFKGDIELRKEVLPLLDNNSFKKLGEKNIDDRQEGEISVREVLQRVEFEQPGNFKVDESLVSGYTYQDKGWGPKTYYEPPISSEIPPFVIEVKPFPVANIPPFFNGVIGPFQISAKVDAPPVLEKGDKFTLNVVFQGPGVHSTIKPINLMCQPGWDGFFRTGDLPPEEKSKPGETRISYELKPLTRLVKEVPPVWLAYFDPPTASYKVIHTPPIPIKVILPTAMAIQEKARSESIVMKTALSMPDNLPPLLPFDDRFYFSFPFGNSTALLLIPAALVLAWLRLFYREREERERLRKPPLEAELFEAKQKLSNLESFALKAKEILQGRWNAKEMPEEARSFLQFLDSVLWGGVKVNNKQALYEELEKLCMKSGKPS